MSFFKSYNKQTAILLVDASGSTKSEFKPTQTIFETIAKVCAQLDHPNFRVLFWNSTGTGDEKFPNGVHIIPFIVKPENLSLTFQMVAKFMKGASTFTHLAFRHIPAEWLKDNPMIYLVTDGEITGSGSITNDNIKSELKNEIVKLGSRLTIITVEAKTIDHSQQESIANAAGSDVFQVVQDAKLTKKITQFVSYTKPTANPSVTTDATTTAEWTRFVHINRNDPPAGFVPYEQRYFSELHMHDFYQYIRNELKECKDDESKQLQIAQNLANTLFYVTKDKPEALANVIVANFAQLFTIDSNLLNHVLTEAIDNERKGTAGVYSAFRKNLKDLYKEAGRLLSKNVKNAIGLNETANSRFVSCPIGGRILVGPGQLVNTSLKIKEGLYPKSSYERVPVFPLDAVERTRTDMQEQCIRQWIRSVYGFLYSTNQTSDEIIFLVLGDMLIVNQSAVIPNDVKQAFVNLGRIMLRKKRMNSMQTELDRLEAGELPVPNSGKINDFFLIMANVARKLKIEAKPMRLWFEICGVLGGKVKEKQQPHCQASAQSNDAKDQWSDTITFPTYQVDSMPDDMNLDYQCVVTMDDTSKVGGWRINLHTRPNLPSCHPVFVFSDTGKAQLLASPNCVCPVCYTPVGVDQFTKVEPRAEFKLNAAYEATPFIRPDGKWNNNGAAPNDEKEDALSSLKPSQQPTNVTAGTRGKIVVMKGVVGCGKTTLAEKIKAHVEARGGVCWVEGVDKYVNQGLDFKQAAVKASESLQEAWSSTATDKVVVIDTCGDHNNNKKFTKFFDVDFRGWTRIDLTPSFDKKNVGLYLAWSLWNVLKRKRNTATSNYLLNPETATVYTCVNVHQKKAQALGWGKSWKFAHVKDASDVEAEALQFKPSVTDISKI